MTQGLLEELGLTVCIISQIFNQSEKLNKQYYGVLQGMKDCLLFGLTNFFTLKSSDFVVYSTAEKSLKQQNLQKNGMSLFELKTHI